MSDERWRRVAEVLDQVLVREPAEWSSVLDDTCGGDLELRGTVESLLQRLETARSFLTTPPAAAAAALLSEMRDTGVEAWEGRQIGAHRIVREIGRGGMSRVFLAERADGAFTQQVAVKLLRPGLDSEIDHERFRAERQILATLNHANIARLLDGGVTEHGLPYLVLEYVAGQPIDQYCEQHALSLNQRIELFLTVIEATQYAHRNLIVHRDLKPSNILVTSDGGVKLLDFGLAKLLEPDAASFAPPLTQAGQRLMTPEYAAPEQIRGESITTLTDVYQLGAVLYQLLTGHMPFGERSGAVHVLEHAVLNTDPPLPSSAAGSDVMRRALRGDVDAIVMKAMRKEPERRYSSAGALLEDLQRFRAGQPVVARPDGSMYRMMKFARRHRAGVAVAGAIALLLTSGAFRERTLRARAEAEAQKANAVGHYLRSVFNVADPYAPRDEHAADVTARTLLDRGAARIDSTLAGEPVVQSELRHLFGHVYSDLGLYDRAAPVLERALEQRRDLYGPRHPAVAEVLDALGTVLTSQGKYDDAESLLREALAQRRALLGNRDTATAATADHLATLLRERDDFARAEPLYREALAIRRTAGGEDAGLASTLLNLGVMLVMKGDYNAAEAPYREALAIQQRVFGANHPETAKTLHNLAQLEGQRGEYEEAEILYRRALAIKRKTLGDRHPSVTVNLNNLGELVSKDDNRLGEAEALLREALTLDRQIFKPPHNYIAEDLRKLANLKRRTGDFNAALSLFQEAHAMHTAVLGPEHLLVALDLNGMGVVLNQTGDFGRSIQHFRASLAQIDRLLGKTHLNYKAVNLNLGRVLRDAGHLPEAERIARTMAAQLDTTKAPELPNYISANTLHGRTLTGMGRAAEAKPILERALAMAQALHGRDNWRTGEAYLALAECFIALREPARARLLLTQARAVLEPQRHVQPVLFAQIENASRRL